MEFLLDVSGRGGIVEWSVCWDNLAACSRLTCSLLSSTSDRFGSFAGAGGAIGFDSGAAAFGVVDVVGVDTFASSTSPSSTSIAVGKFGVETPRELMRYQ